MTLSRSDTVRVLSHLNASIIRATKARDVIAAAHAEMRKKPNGNQDGGTKKAARKR